MSGKEITLKSLKKLCEEEIIGHKQVTIIVIIASSIFHFRWEQTRPKYYNSQSVNKQILNHLPNHEAISDKCSLVKNLKVFCEKNEE